MQYINQIIPTIINLLAAGILVITFLIIASRSLSFYVRLFALQSFLLSAVAFFSMIGSGDTHIIVSVILTIIVKVIGIPYVLNKVINKIKVQKEVDFNINITLSLLICGCIVVLSNSVAEQIVVAQQFANNTISKVLPISISVMLIGIFIMISRKKAITQIIGLLTIENGVFLAGLSITSGMPMIVEVGIFFDILMAALILGVFVFKINKTFDAIDIDSLRGLKH